jgi:hypothetical protein
MHLVHRDFLVPVVCPLAHLALILARLPPRQPKETLFLRLCASRVPDYVKIRRRNIHSIHGRGPEIVSTPISRACGTSKLREKPLSQSECHKRPHETYCQIVAGIRVTRAEDRSPSLGSRPMVESRASWWWQHGRAEAARPGVGCAMLLGTMTCMHLSVYTAGPHGEAKCETYYLSCISARTLVVELSLIDCAGSCIVATVSRCCSLVALEALEAQHWSSP